MTACTRLISLVLVFVSLLSAPPVVGAGESKEGKGTSPGIGQKWAFCIGVGNYWDPQIEGLPKARNDAKGLARVLEEHGGFDHVMVLTDDLDKKAPLFPSSKNIQALFHQYAAKIHPDDLILFSFSGQGMTDSAGRAFFLTPETQWEVATRTGLPFDAVLEFFRKTGVKRSIILVDASRERVRKKGGESGEGIYPDRYLRKGVTAVFYGARKGTYSHDDGGSEYGVFTRFVINGLQGEADTQHGGNRDGMVSLYELGSYVGEELSRWSVENRVRQLPDTSILDGRLAGMVLSSVQKTGLSKVGLAEPPAQKVPALKEKKEPDVKDAAVEKKRATPQKETKQTRDAVILSAPAPKIEELVKEEKAAPAKKEEASQRAPVKEEVKEAPATVTEKKEAPPIPPPVVAALPQKEKEPIEQEKTSPPVVEKGVEVEKAPERLAYAPREAKREPLNLRKKGKDLNPEEVRSVLTTYNFYATCWNYNGDFCNADGDFENQFQDNQDGTVTDKATGLMWQKGGARENMTWLAAREYAEKMNKERLAGFSDWRLPTVEELASLMENSWKNGDLFIDPVFDREMRNCWSLDTRGMEAAWKANFHQGFFLDFPMTSKNSARLVRALQ